MNTDATEIANSLGGTIKCKDCGANLKYAPGTSSLKCEYCQAENTIQSVTKEIKEEDFEAYIQKKSNNSEKQNISTVKCDGCGASTTLPANITSSNCPYCDTPLVIKNATTCDIIKPKYLLPFKVERNQAKDEFIKWAGSRWFAPSKLKDYARHSAERLRGVYMPYWTYDTNTISNYTGQRGDYYYTTETYRDSNGNTQTRQVRHTRWSSASGTVYHDFNDVLVCASHSLPEQMVNQLEPWDLPELVAYNDQFLAGFITESYQTDLKTGFDAAKERMAPVIQGKVRSDIGGDEQQITSLHSQYNDISFKHILLPLWISAYKYNNKVYRFTVNARTGEVEGERPYSFWKIFFFVLGILGAIGVIIWMMNSQDQGGNY